MKVIMNVGKEVGLNLKLLYDSVETLQYAEIVADFDSDNRMSYFDLYNKKGELACLDGERVRIIAVNDDYVTFCNAKESMVEFLLSGMEASIAVFQ